MRGTRAATMGAALLVCACSSPGERARPTPRPPLTPSVVSTFGVHVRLHGDDRVVLPEAVGAGVRDLGAVKVPATYDVLWHCIGGPVIVLIDGFQVTPNDECDDGQTTFTRSRPPGHDSVSIKVSTDSRSVWALAIVAAR